MGAGKSEIGLRLAKSLGAGFVDLDAAIVQRCGLPIAELFAQRGEAVFRRFEVETLMQTGKDTVIALGGGAFAEEPVRKWLHRHAISIFLDWPFELLYQRIQGDSSRPLAQAWRLRLLYRKRRVLYAVSDFVLPLHDDRPEAVVQLITSCFRDPTKNEFC